MLGRRRRLRGPRRERRRGQSDARGRRVRLGLPARRHSPHASDVRRAHRRQPALQPDVTLDRLHASRRLPQRRHALLGGRPRPAIGARGPHRPRRDQSLLDLPAHRRVDELFLLHRHARHGRKGRHFRDHPPRLDGRGPARSEVHRLAHSRGVPARALSLPERSRCGQCRRAHSDARAPALGPRQRRAGDAVAAGRSAGHPAAGRQYRRRLLRRTGRRARPRWSRVVLRHGRVGGLRVARHRPRLAPVCEGRGGRRHRDDGRLVRRGQRWGLRESPPRRRVERGPVSLGWRGSTLACTRATFS